MKKVIIILLIFLCSACSNKNFKQENINTIIEENNSELLISINYPTTNIKLLDKRIDKEINEIYKAFKKDFNSPNSNSELNIDYTYDVINNNYINITLEVFIDSAKLAHPYTYMLTYVFDINNNKFLTIDNLIKDLSILQKDINSKLKSKYKDCLVEEFQIDNNLMFTFDDVYLTIYFNPYTITSGYCGIINIDLKLDNHDLKIEIKKDKEIAATYVSNTKQNKVIDPNKPVIALTFDDGPSSYTKAIIDILNAYGVNATFFVLGNKVEIYSEIIRESIESGNEIGNHSYNHKQLTRLSSIEIQEQINKTQTIINEVSGYTPTLLRPTYGEINKKVRNNSNLKIVLWNIDSLDWKKKNSEKIAEHVINKAKDEGIILMHDTMERTSKAIKIIIPELLEKGYQFVTISELEEVKLLRKN